MRWERPAAAALTANSCPTLIVENRADSMVDSEDRLLLAVPAFDEFSLENVVKNLQERTGSQLLIRTKWRSKTSGT